MIAQFGQATGLRWVRGTHSGSYRADPLRPRNPAPHDGGVGASAGRQEADTGRVPPRPLRAGVLAGARQQNGSAAPSSPSLARDDNPGDGRQEANMEGALSEERPWWEGP